MIIRISEPRGVRQHRALRRSSNVHAPVVAVAPDTRRISGLLAQQLAAMGLAVEELRSRRGGSTHLARWWRAWTAGSKIERIVLLNPQLAHPQALCGYLVLLRELVSDVVLLERPVRSDGYEAIMAELEAETACPSEVRGSAPTSGQSSPIALPRVPRTGTLTFVAACEQTLPDDDLRRVRQRYDATLAHARTALAGHDPRELLRMLWATGASAGTTDGLLVSLHAIRLAAWATGVTLRFDPHTVVRRAGATLLAVGDDRLWSRLAMQVDANRAVSQCLGVLGWAVDDILSLTVDDATDLRASGGLPLAVARVLSVATAARVSVDGVAGQDPLMVDPTRPALDARTVGRWIRLATVDHLAPTIGNHLRRRHVDAAQQLHDLGLEWIDA